jgi:hypothetical protein
MGKWNILVHHSSYCQPVSEDPDPDPRVQRLSSCSANHEAACLTRSLFCLRCAGGGLADTPQINRPSTRGREFAFIHNPAPVFQPGKPNPINPGSEDDKIGRGSKSIPLYIQECKIEAIAHQKRKNIFGQQNDCDRRMRAGHVAWVIYG